MKMKNIISAGDFIDIYQKLLHKRPSFFLKKLHISSTSRVINTWDANENPPIHWWSIPKVNERWNKIITGEPNMDFPDYVINKYLKNKQKLRMISPGCGTGHTEIKFAKYNCFSRIEGFDLSSSRIHLANKSSKKLGLNNLFFSVEEAHKHNFRSNKYDIVLFNSSLHHFNNLKIILEKTYNSMKYDGLLIINEYTGPNRFQWTDEQLKKANHYLNKIPFQYRKFWQSNRIKKKIYRPGLLRMILSDPSEAVNSEEILPQIRKKFKKLEEKPYGGNLLHLIFKDISHNFIENKNDINKILNFLFKAEDTFIEKNNQSDFIFGVYTKR
jgi:ubiquinone/menaquinone biosynthesis C-methylase UbiE